MMSLNNWHFEQAFPKVMKNIKDSTIVPITENTC